MKRVHFGLLGQSVEYSRSPEIFRALFEISGVPGEFTTFNVAPQELCRSVAELPSNGIDAICVTIPHKEMIIPYLNTIDKTAESIRSVNSVKFDGGKSYGMNTDVYGFSRGLGEKASALKGKSALILGAGGAARSAALGLALDCEVRAITLMGRDETRCKRAVDDLSKTLERGVFSTASLSENDNEDKLYEIVVNATPLGGPNVRVRNPDSILKSVTRTSLYYDLNYNRNNELLCAARSRGIATLDGFPMLVYQALRSFALWTGVTIDYDRAINHITKS